MPDRFLDHDGRFGEVLDAGWEQDHIEISWRQVRGEEIPTCECGAIVENARRLFQFRGERIQSKHMMTIPLKSG